MMNDHNVFLAEAGPKHESAVFESVELTEPEAHATTDQWYHDCVNTDEWWFSVTKMGLVVDDE